jgi:DNA repair protein RadC
MYEDKKLEKHRVSSPEDVWVYTKDMHNLAKEQLRGLYLNVKHQIIHDEIISIGTIDQSIAHPREIYKPAIIHSAASMILIHNHPSGDLTPSRADQELTEQVARIGRLLCIPLLDHIIVSYTGYKSLI